MNVSNPTETRKQYDVIFPTPETTWGKAFSRRMDRLEDRMPAEGFLYHGTSIGRAELIIKEGFRSRIGALAEEGREAIYWGPACTAFSFAAKTAMLDGIRHGDKRAMRPAVFAARVENVLASGTPMPLDEWDVVTGDTPATWQDSLAKMGCLYVLGGRHVGGMSLILPD